MFKKNQNKLQTNFNFFVEIFSFDKNVYKTEIKFLSLSSFSHTTELVFLCLFCIFILIITVFVHIFIFKPELNTK